MNECTLPTEPGYYLDNDGDLWRLTVFGEWVFPESDDFAGKHERYAPFARLLTEAEWGTKHPRLTAEQLSTVLNTWMWADSKSGAAEPEDVWQLMRDLRALAKTPEGSK